MRKSDQMTIGCSSVSKVGFVFLVISPEFRMEKYTVYFSILYRQRRSGRCSPLYRNEAKIAPSKVECVFSIVAVSKLPHAEFGRNDHRADVPHFIDSWLGFFFLSGSKTVLHYLNILNFFLSWFVFIICINWLSQYRIHNQMIIIVSRLAHNHFQSSEDALDEKTLTWTTMRIRRTLPLTLHVS